MPYTCTHCGEIHEGLPAIGSTEPSQFYDVPEGERNERIALTAETCIIDEEEYYIRGVLSLPIQGEEETLDFGVWVSQKKENFDTYVQQPDTPDIGPFFGWLCTHIEPLAPTLSSKTTVHFTGQNLRPKIVLHRSDDPISIAQQEGISLDNAWHIVHKYLDE